MGEYKISAIKYRPKKFEEVVGQNDVTSTLENAINKGKLGQALLFSGPRGVGKTTCARILAKKVNLHEDKNNDYSFNIFELDAASNNGVDHIRELNEKVRVPPRIGNYKVYIIDEVHMLSIGAFNAFLKTLEEPPSHAIFILATTEKSKILPTVLSRCQIFDFKRISVLDIKKKLESILIEQKIPYDDEALFLISESSEGSLRDALQILDRMINFCENEITINEVSKNLNIVGSKLYLEICDEIIEKNIPKVLLMLDEIILNGFSEVNFIIGLSNHFRNLFFCKNNNTFKLIESSEKLKEFYLEQSNKVDITWIRKGLKIINTFEINFKNINNKRIHAELCLMQISSIKKEGKNISKKKDNFKNNNKLLENEKNKSDVNTKNTENLVPKNNYKAKENTKSELEKKSTESDKSINEVSSYSLASVEKKRYSIIERLILIFQNQNLQAKKIILHKKI